ncbi:MAG TPA: GNAT family N-acetyltransferase [Cellvibrionaceae bacterium]
MSELKITILAHPDQAQISTLLSAAFANDPVYRYFLQGCPAADIDRLRYQLVSFIVAYHCSAGRPVWGLHHGDKLLACALLETPVSSWRGAVALLLHLPKLIGKVPLASIQRMNRYAVKSREELPKNINHYLVKIGVAPGHQGAGYGKKLITAMMEYCRDRAQILALDTENPDNVPLYQHLGFQLHDANQLDTLTIYRMFYTFE